MEMTRKDALRVHCVVHAFVNREVRFGDENDIFSKHDFVGPVFEELALRYKPLDDERFDGNARAMGRLLLETCEAGNDEFKGCVIVALAILHSRSMEVLGVADTMEETVGRSVEKVEAFHAEHPDLDLEEAATLYWATCHDDPGRAFAEKVRRRLGSEALDALAEEYPEDAASIRQEGW